MNQPPIEGTSFMDNYSDLLLSELIKLRDRLSAKMNEYKNGTYNQSDSRIAKDLVFKFSRDLEMINNEISYRGSR